MAGACHSGPGPGNATQGVADGGPFALLAGLDRACRNRIATNPRPLGARPMKIFLDTADIEEIRTAARWGVLDGVTTNPTLYAKVGGSYDDILKQVCRLTSGPVSAECVKDDVDGMLEE